MAMRAKFYHARRGREGVTEGRPDRASLPATLLPRASARALLAALLRALVLHRLLTRLRLRGLVPVELDGLARVLLVLLVAITLRVLRHLLRSFHCVLRTLRKGARRIPVGIRSRRP